MNKKKILGFAVMLLLFFVFAGSVQAALVGSTSQATFSISPESASFGLNDSFTASIYINTNGQSVVAAAAHINFDKNSFQALSIDNTGSIFTIEAEKVIDNANGIIKITRAIPSPGVNVSNGFVAKISFKAISGISPSSDNITFSFAAGSTLESNIIKNDGLGTDILTGVYNAKYSVLGAVNPVLNLSASLSASPSSGNYPMSSILTAAVSGTAVGNINYTFYCNRSDSGTNITAPYDWKIDNQSSATQSFTCSYNQAGIYYPKVIVERGAALPAESRAIVSVSSAGAPGGGGSGFTPPFVPDAGQKACFALVLRLGDSHSQIALIQQYLSLDKTVYPEGIVSGFFGNLTKAAITRFQAKYGLDQTGEIDEATLRKLNEIYCSQSQQNTAVITINLKYGMSHEQVRSLQAIMAKDPSVYPEGIVSGYFGQLTLNAVRKFQLKYGITTPQVIGYGIVGPATRAKLNSLR